MDGKNIRKNPFGPSNETQSNPNIPPTKTNIPPKLKSEEFESKKPESKPVFNSTHYSDENNNINIQEYDNLKNFNSSKNFIRLSCDRYLLLNKTTVKSFFNEGMLNILFFIFKSIIFF